jgi:hypothetical protein
VLQRLHGCHRRVVSTALLAKASCMLKAVTSLADPCSPAYQHILALLVVAKARHVEAEARSLYVSCWLQVCWLHHG